MTTLPLIHPAAALPLAFAVVASSTTPLLLLDDDLLVLAASESFFHIFQIKHEDITGQSVFDLGSGEWDVPELRALLNATAAGSANIDAYEMDLRSTRGPRRLVVNAHRLNHDDAGGVRILLALADVTDTRLAEKLKDDLLREKAVLMNEVQHRIANSLQIIASVIMQSARKVQSEETRLHLRDAHQRVMSIATLQQQLAASTTGMVSLSAYFTQLCQSIGASMIRDPAQLKLEVSVDDSSVSADASVSLGLIVTELVINCLKHGFPGERPGKITVGYQSIGKNWTLSVRDNGVGMPRGEPKPTPGLGTSIVEALAKQLRAEVRIIDQHPGTMVMLVHRHVIAARPAGAVERSI